MGIPDGFTPLYGSGSEPIKYTDAKSYIAATGRDWTEVRDAVHAIAVGQLEKEEGCATVGDLVTRHFGDSPRGVESIVLATEGDKIVGFTIVSKYGQSGYVPYCAVDPAFHGRYVGMRMRDVAIKKMKEIGALYYKSEYISQSDKPDSDPAKLATRVKFHERVKEKFHGVTHRHAVKEGDETYVHCFYELEGYRGLDSSGSGKASKVEKPKITLEKSSARLSAIDAQQVVVECRSRVRSFWETHRDLSKEDKKLLVSGYIKILDDPFELEKTGALLTLMRDMARIHRDLGAGKLWGVGWITPKEMELVQARLEAVEELLDQFEKAEIKDEVWPLEAVRAIFSLNDGQSQASSRVESSVHVAGGGASAGAAVAPSPSSIVEIESVRKSDPKQALHMLEALLNKSESIVLSKSEIKEIVMKHIEWARTDLDASARQVMFQKWGIWGKEGEGIWNLCRRLEDGDSIKFEYGTCSMRIELLAEKIFKSTAEDVEQVREVLTLIRDITKRLQESQKAIGILKPAQAVFMEERMKEHEEILRHFEEAGERGIERALLQSWALGIRDDLFW